MRKYYGLRWRRSPTTAFSTPERKDKAGNQKRTAREIDFVAAKGGKRVYIQSAYAMESSAKQDAEKRPFALTGDFFPKIVVRHDVHKRWYDDNGVLNIGVIDFLLDDELV